MFGQSFNEATQTHCYNPVAPAYLIWAYYAHGRQRRCQEDPVSLPSGRLEKTTRSSPHYMAQHRPSGSETSPSYAPRSSRFGSEPPSVEDDVNVWRYAIVSCMSETTMLSVTKWYYIVVCSVLFCGQVDENMKTAQKRDAVLNEKFYFRKDLTTCEWVMNSLKWFSAVLLVLSLYHSIQFCVVLIALMSHVKLSHVESLICSNIDKISYSSKYFCSEGCYNFFGVVTEKLFWVAVWHCWSRCSLAVDVVDV